MVVSGITEDKPQIGTLVQFTGVGLYRPGLDAEAVSEMVDKILADASYRQNAERIKEKYKDYDPIDRLDEIIQDRTRQFEEGSIWNR